MMIKKIVLIILCILFSSPCFAEDIYIAQSSAGGDTGADCANAHSMVWFNTSGNWGAGAGKISAGDTAHFCGTITTTASTQGSGSVGSPITLIFESGAKFSKAYWGTSTSAAIYCSSNDYITIDGNSIGIIENTANGTSLANQQDSHGIYLSACDNWEIKNLTIQNIYVRDVDSSDSNEYGNGIQTRGSNSISIHNNTINHAYYLLYIITASAVALSDYDIYSNTLSSMSTGIVVALGSDGSSIDDVKIYSNTITGGNVWDGTWGAGLWHHGDGIHTWTRGGNQTDKITNLKIYGNTIGPDMGAHTTSWIYLSDMTEGAIVYNNVLYNTTEGPTSGFIHILTNYSPAPNLGTKIYNNTIIGGGATYGIESQGCTGHDIRNNIVTNVIYGIAELDANSATTTCNYNDWYGLIGAGGDTFYRANVAKTYAEWKALGFDANSITSDPDLNSDYTEKSTSPTRNTGTDLSGTFTTDKAGTTRVAWDIGAYEWITEYTLSLTINGTGSGTVTSSPSGINSSSSTTADFDDGTVVTLTAYPAYGSTFAGWSGTGGCSGTSTCALTMSEARAATATFNLTGVMVNSHPSGAIVRGGSVR